MLGPPLDERQVIGRPLAGHPGERHQPHPDQVGRVCALLPVGVLGPAGVRLDRTDQGVGHLRGLQGLVLIRVDLDDHLERGQQRGQVLVTDDLARELTRARCHHTPAFPLLTPAIASEGYRHPVGRRDQTEHPDAEAFPALGSTR